MLETGKFCMSCGKNKFLREYSLRASVVCTDCEDEAKKKR